LLKGSSYAKQLILEQDSARVEKQKALAPRLKALRNQREKEIPELRSKRSKAEDKENRLLAAAKEATQERIRAATEESTRSWWFSHQQEKIVAEVKGLAPPCIDDFKSELWLLETETRTTCELRSAKPRKISSLTDSVTAMSPMSKQQRSVCGDSRSKETSRGSQTTADS
jgi:Fe-S cluster assembly scaffold protein SufB